MLGFDIRPAIPRQIFRGGSFEADAWIFLADADPLPSAGDVVVGKDRFLIEATAIHSRTGAIGVLMTPGESLDGIADHLDRIALIVLRIAKYSDGRPYSVARLLRDRHGYRGEIRATGDVLRDQIVFLLRAGFDSFDIQQPGTIAALQSGSIVAVHRHYQPASADDREMLVGHRPWLRLSSPL